MGSENCSFTTSHSPPVGFSSQMSLWFLFDHYTSTKKLNPTAKKDSIIWVRVGSKKWYTVAFSLCLGLPCKGRVDLGWLVHAAPGIISAQARPLLSSLRCLDFGVLDFRHFLHAPLISISLSWQTCYWNNCIFPPSVSPFERSLTLCSLSRISFSCFYSYCAECFGSCYL